MEEKGGNLSKEFKKAGELLIKNAANTKVLGTFFAISLASTLVVNQKTALLVIAIPVTMSILGFTLNEVGKLLEKKNNNSPPSQSP